MNIKVKTDTDKYIQINVEELLEMDVNNLPDLMVKLPLHIAQFGIYLANAKLEKSNAANDVKVKKAAIAKFYKEVVAPRDGLKTTIAHVDEYVSTHLDVIEARNNRETTAHTVDSLVAIVSALQAKLDVAKLLFRENVIK